MALLCGDTAFDDLPCSASLFSISSAVSLCVEYHDRKNAFTTDSYHTRQHNVRWGLITCLCTLRHVLIRP
jgi:hypothetical protein